MPRRRSRGEGSLYFLKSKGLWVSKITLPDGTCKVKYRKLQKDVRDHHLTALRQVKEGVMPKDDTFTVSQFVTNYMKTVGKHNLRPKTIESYSSLLKTHIVPGLGKTLRNSGPITYKRSMLKNWKVDCQSVQFTSYTPLCISS